MEAHLLMGIQRHVESANARTIIQLLFVILDGFIYQFDWG